MLSRDWVQLKLQNINILHTDMYFIMLNDFQAFILYLLLLFYYYLNK